MIHEHAPHLHTALFNRAVNLNLKKSLHPIIEQRKIIQGANENSKAKLNAREQEAFGLFHI